MPALFQAWRHGKLPEGGRIVAVSRQELGDEAYRDWLKERFHEVEDAKRPSDEEFARFASLVHYLRMDLSQPGDYARLKAWLGSTAGRAAPADVVVMFLATSPDLFPLVCAQLGASGLNGPNVRVVLEKPLGHDLASAREINRVVRSVFAEEQAFRIDHYLGKPAVQNLMALRFGNVLFEPLWRRECIANVQITIAESIGVGTRGDFYGRTGALRDMIQNHALQLLTMVAMEPPSRMVADAIRDEKLKVLRSLKPFSIESVGRDVVRGQYRAGMVDGKATTAFSKKTRSPPGAPPRHSSPCARRCRTGAGRASRSTCAPASAWPSATRRSSSTSGARRTPSFPAPTRPTGWSSSCSRKTASSFTCSPPRAPARARRSRPSRSTSTSTRRSPRTASAPTSGCCST